MALTRGMPHRKKMAAINGPHHSRWDVAVGGADATFLNGAVYRDRHEIVREIE
jgi:hypothetical protein